MPAIPAIEKRQAPASNIEDLARMLNAFVSAVVDGVRPLLASPRARSVVQSGVAVAATATVINHKVNLGVARTPNGWAITDIDTNATVKRTAWDASTITLQASGACTVQLEVW